MASTLSGIRNSFKQRTIRMAVAEAIAHARVVVANHERNVSRGHSSANATALVKTKVAGLYIRAGMRAIGTGDSYLITQSLELASINVLESYQRMGACKQILDGFEQLAKETKRIVYVENVLNEHLDNYLRVYRLYRPLYGVPSGCETFWFDPRKPLILGKE